MIGLLTSLILLGGIGFAIWTGAGMAINPAERAEMDFARVAKSAGLAVALGLALAGVTNGLIQLLQGIVGGTRIEGSNDDLAFGLSMLIVSAPVFFLIARYLDQQRISRHQEGKNPIGIGWSVHYVACSSVLLVGVLSSAGIVIDDMFRNGFSNRDVQADEVAQLIGWLAVYLTYWFGMRPRFGVRGYVHLLVGTILGLIWIVGSIWALANGLLGQAYDSVFREPVADSTSLTVLIPPAIIGIIVWLSHWRILNGNGNRIETNPNRSQSWFATVVGLAIVPAVIMLISIGTALVASVLVWFLGSTSESAADYFAYVPTLVVGALISFAVWAYHRSLVIAGGSPTRTESLRFHDYAVAAVGLGAVVVGIARLVNHAFEALARRQAIADTYGVGNNVIITLCLLAVGSGVWWTVWSRIERSRSADPVGEIESIWRKIYLGLAGALVLFGSSILFLFVFLEDVIDGDLGLRTLSSMSGPIGAIVAVVGAVWYHYGVWRSDRSIQGARTPPPPPPTAAPPHSSPPHSSGPPASASPLVAASPPATASPLVISNPPPEPGIQLSWDTAGREGELFTLQRASFVDEAMAYGTPQVPTLTETFDAFRSRIDRHRWWPDRRRCKPAHDRWPCRTRAIDGRPRPTSSRTWQQSRDGDRPTCPHDGPHESQRDCRRP